MKSPVKKLLHKSIAGWREERDHKIVHASSLTSQDTEFCPREYHLLDVLDKKQPDVFIGTALATTFDTGNALAKAITDVYLKDYAVGNWKCIRCDHVFEFSRIPKECGCGGENFEYLEVMFYSQKFGFSSSLDLILDMPGEKLLRTVELKTMKADQFKTLVAPLAEHKIRTNLYMTAIKTSDHPNKNEINLEVASILYVMKGFGVKDTSIQDMGIKDQNFSPYKEFQIDVDIKVTKPYLAKAKELKGYRDYWNKHKKSKGLPPMLKECERNGKRANSCSVKSECFHKGGM